MKNMENPTDVPMELPIPLKIKVTMNNVENPTDVPMELPTPLKIKVTMNNVENPTDVPMDLPTPLKNSFYRTLNEAFFVAYGRCIPSSLQKFTVNWLILIAKIHGAVVYTIYVIKKVLPFISLVVSNTILVVMSSDVITDAFSTARICHAQPDVASVDFLPLCWVSGATILIPSIVNNCILLFYYWPNVGNLRPVLVALFCFQLLPYVRQVLEIKSKWHRWKTRGEAQPNTKTALIVKLMFSLLEDTPQLIIQTTLFWREATGRKDGIIDLNGPLVYIGLATSSLSISYGITMFMVDPSSTLDAVIKYFLTMITIGGRILLCIWWGYQIINGKFYYNPFGVNEIGYILYLCTPGYALLALVMFHLGTHISTKQNETEIISLRQRAKQIGRTFGKLLFAATLDGITVDGLIATLTYLLHYQLFSGIERAVRGRKGDDHEIYLAITILLGISVIINMIYNSYNTIMDGNTTIIMFLKCVSTIIVIGVRVLSFLFLICDAIVPMWWSYALPIISFSIILLSDLLIFIYHIINKHEVENRFPKNIFSAFKYLGNLIVCAIVDGVSFGGLLNSVFYFCFTFYYFSKWSKTTWRQQRLSCLAMFDDTVPTLLNITLYASICACVLNFVLVMWEIITERLHKKHQYELHKTPHIIVNEIELQSVIFLGI